MALFFVGQKQYQLSEPKIYHEKEKAILILKTILWLKGWEQNLQMILKQEIQSNLRLKIVNLVKSKNKLLKKFSMIMKYF